MFKKEESLKDSFNRQSKRRKTARLLQQREMERALYREKRKGKEPAPINEEDRFEDKFEAKFDDKFEEQMNDIPVPPSDDPETDGSLEMIPDEEKVLDYLVIEDPFISDRIYKNTYFSKFDAINERRKALGSGRKLDPQIIYGNLDIIREQNWIDILQKDRIYSELQKLNERIDQLTEQVEVVEQIEVEEQSAS